MVLAVSAEQMPVGIENVIVVYFMMFSTIENCFPNLIQIRAFDMWRMLIVKELIYAFKERRST